MSCSAEIQTDTHPNVLVVPLQSVTTRDEKRWQETQQQGGGDENAMAVTVEKKKEEKKKPQEVVFIVESGLARKKKVHTGISDDTYIEVIDGLKEGVEVIKGNYRAVSRDLDDSVKIRIENTRQFQSSGEEKK
jgi:HlyD family secretion protein